jgi:hypothetical protein
MELKTVKVRCLVSGTVTAQGKETQTLYIFKDNIPVDVYIVDLPNMLDATYKSGGCCGAPSFTTPYFQLIE